MSKRSHTNLLSYVIFENQHLGECDFEKQRLGALILENHICDFGKITLNALIFTKAGYLFSKIILSKALIFEKHTYYIGKSTPNLVDLGGFRSKICA